MTTTKKQRERQSLNTVLDRFAISPKHVNETEKPDFLLTIDGTIVGAEVTELYLPSPDVHLPIQATENEARVMVAMACKKAEQGKIPPQHVSVRISRHFLKKQNRDRVSEALFDYVSSNFAAPGEVKSGKRYHVPKEIVHITMYGLRSSDHQWNSLYSGWIYSNFTDGFRKAIAKKEPLLPKYLQRCDKCWLITVAKSTGSSSFIEWSDELACHDFSAQFERVFFVEGINNTAYELQLAIKVTEQ